MMKLFLVGCGTGNPDHITMEGLKALRAAQLILLPVKGTRKSALADIRREILTTHLGTDAPQIQTFEIPSREPDIPYQQAVLRWHDEIAHRWQAALTKASSPEKVALMIWGDPSLYDSAIRIAERLRPVPEIQVIPGISAIQVLTAAHKIPLNRLAGDITIMTGRNLRETGIDDSIDNVVVMLDGETSFTTLSADAFDIYWGAYLGMTEQILLSGRLADIADEIIHLRAEARTRHGWIMDSYLLRRRP